MKISLLYIGKTDKAYLKEGIKIFSDRLVHYVPFSIVEIPDIKNTKKMSEDQQKQKEGELILQKIAANDELLLLDDKGKHRSSMDFSNFINNKMIMGGRNIVFVIGGPYGFSDAVYQRANGKISLSKMTFSHQMVRLIFLEQLYRAMTIIRGEPYHHE